jgi:phage head maturation protease
MHATLNLPPGVEIKRATSDISTVTPTGVFEGYASLFGLIDAGRDEVVPGAFAASLAKRGASGVKMLWQHRAAADARARRRRSVDRL